MKLTAILGAIELLKKLFGSLDEDTKKAIDKALDALEDKYPEGTWEDVGMEFAVKIIRGTADIPDYPDIEVE